MNHNKMPVICIYSIMPGIPSLRDLCAPASFYLIISLISIVTMIVQNSYTSSDIYCLGNYSCSGNKISIILTSIIYALFWTWVLNIICKGGGEIVAWFLVLLPFLLFFIMLLSYMAMNL